MKILSDSCCLLVKVEHVPAFGFTLRDHHHNDKDINDMFKVCDSKRRSFTLLLLANVYRIAYHTTYTIICKLRYLQNLSTYAISSSGLLYTLYICLM